MTLFHHFTTIQESAFMKSVSTRFGLKAMLRHFSAFNVFTVLTLGAGYSASALASVVDHQEFEASLQVPFRADTSLRSLPLHTGHFERGLSEKLWIASSRCPHFWHSYS